MRNPFKSKPLVGRPPVAGTDPGDYPLGSPESRAAARARLDREFESVEVIVLNTHCNRPSWAPPADQKRPLPGEDGKVLVILHNDDPIPAWLTPRLTEAERRAHTGSPQSQPSPSVADATSLDELPRPATEAEAGEPDIIDLTKPG